MKQQKHEGTAYNLANVLSALGQVPADARADAVGVAAWRVAAACAAQPRMDSLGGREDIQHIILVVSFMMIWKEEHCLLLHSILEMALSAPADSLLAHSQK